MREQPMRVKTGAAKKRIIFFAVIVVTVILVVAAIYAIQYNPPYTPPPFEPAAVSGMPNPPENMRYSEIDAMGKFTLWIAGTMYQQKDGSLYLYFTNPETNTAYLMCEIVDKKGSMLYKSGLLRPSEYVERLYPAKKLKNEAVNIKVNIYAFTPETFHSVGTIAIDNILQPH